ncbi:dethiobiotin synthase [Corynebacteriaceae bacterium 6-324]
MIIIVSGTGTDIGKTIAVAALASFYQSRALEVVVAKPVQTGEEAGKGDIFTVSALVDVETAEYVRYPDPLAPNLAARRAGQSQLTQEEVIEWIRALDGPRRVVLVEGAGGLLVRLADSFTLADVAVKLQAPLVVVTSLGLGSLNWAELTVREAQRRGISVAGLIGGCRPQVFDLATQLNIEELENVTGVRLWGCIPEGVGKLNKVAFAQMARHWLRSLPEDPGALDLLAREP